MTSIRSNFVEYAREHINALIKSNLDIERLRIASSDRIVHTSLLMAFSIITTITSTATISISLHIEISFMETIKSNQFSNSNKIVLAVIIRNLASLIRSSFLQIFILTILNIH